MQFEQESSKKTALLKNRTTVRDHIISVLPSKFPAVIPESTRKSDGESFHKRHEDGTDYTTTGSAAPARFNPYLSNPGSSRSDSAAAPKRPKLRYFHVQLSSNHTFILICFSISMIFVVWPTRHERLMVLAVMSSRVDGQPRDSDTPPLENRLFWLSSLAL